jgi:lipoate---protein ligase
VKHSGTSDLALANTREAGTPLKFSGNSMRAKRTHLLYHGTLLYGCDLALLSTCLRMPPRKPDYRGARPHAEFVTNLPTTRHRLIYAVGEAWPTSSELIEWPKQRVATLVAKRFGQARWNREFV